MQTEKPNQIENCALMKEFIYLDWKLASSGYAEAEIRKRIQLGYIAIN